MVPPPARQLVVTLLREPIARTFSEFKHVCSLGRGQWDYSTRAWRDKTWSQFPSADSTADARALQGDGSTALYASAVAALNTTTARPRPLPQAGKGLGDDNMFDGTEAWFRYDPKACSSMATLVSFVVAKEHANGVDNRQARMLAGALLEPHTPEPRTVATDLFPRAQLALATRVDFAFVTELFDLGLLLLAQRLGVPPPTTYEHVSEFLPQQPLPTEINLALSSSAVDARIPGSSTPSAAPWAVAWVKHLNRFDATLHAAAAFAIAKAARAAGLGEPQGSETDTVNTTPRGPFYRCTDVRPPRRLTPGPTSGMVTQVCALLTGAAEAGTRRGTRREGPSFGGA
jgi:hypothetical protein